MSKGWSGERQRHAMSARGIRSISKRSFIALGKSKRTKGEEKILEWLKSIVKLKKMQCFKGQKSHEYCGMEDYVLRNGQFFKPMKKLPEGIEKGEIKMCFSNAFNCIVSEPDLYYVEGYAVTKGLKDFPIAFEHAWLVDNQGNVIDPTWEDGDAYFGVAFDTDFVVETITEKKYTGLLDDWQNKWPLLRDEKPDIRVKIGVVS